MYRDRRDYGHENADCSISFPHKRLHGEQKKALCLINNFSADSFLDQLDLVSNCPHQMPVPVTGKGSLNCQASWQRAPYLPLIAGQIGLHHLPLCRVQCLLTIQMQNRGNNAILSQDLIWTSRESEVGFGGQFCAVLGDRKVTNTIG